MRKLPCVLLLGIVVASMFALSGLMTPASGVLELTETSVKAIGATTINWTSSFRDLDYTLGDTIRINVTWIVVAGNATYVRFDPRRPYFTPRSQKDPANGTTSSVSQSGNTVTVEFKFTDLHLDRKRNVEIGNAKFKLYLKIDTNYDNIPDTILGYGVNVHVEDPQ